MSTGIDRLRWLDDCPTEQQCVVLAAALSLADDDERDDIAIATIDAAASPATPRPMAATTFAVVIERLHRLGSRAHRHLLELADAPADAARLALESGDTRTMANVIELIRMRRDLRLADVLVALLDDSDAKTSRDAQQTLLNLTLHATATVTRRPGDPESAQRLDRLIADAVADLGRHRFDGLMLATAILATPAPHARGPQLSRVLGDPDHPIWFGIRRIIGRTDETMVRRLALRWLGRADLSQAVLRRWPALMKHHAVAEVFDDVHLLLAPARRRALRSIDRPLKCLPALGTAMNLPPSSQKSLPQYVAALRLNGPVKAARLAELADLPSPWARLHVVSALSGRPDAGAVRALAALSEDGDRHVAALAARERLRHATRLDDAALEQLTTHAAPGVASAALRTKAMRDPHACVSVIDRLEPRVATAFARMHRAETPETFDAAVASGLTSATGGRLCALVRVVDALDLVAAHMEALLNLVWYDDPHVVAAVAKALGRAFNRDTPAQDAVVELLDHADGRVRSNAAEAIFEIDPDDALNRCEPLLADPVPRPCASVAVKMRRARPDRARQAVRGLLHSDTLAFVHSGIWAARRVGGRVIAHELQDIGAAASDPNVRTRAGIAASLLNRDHVRSDATYASAS